MIAEAANSLCLGGTCEDAVLAGNGHVSSLAVQACVCTAAILLFSLAIIWSTNSQWREQHEREFPPIQM